MKHLPPEWAVDIKSSVDAGKRLILFIDELTTATPAMQGPLLGLILDRRLGQIQFGPNLAVVAAANPPDMAAGGWELTPPLANRLLHVKWSGPSAQDWAEGLVTGWGKPPASLLDGPEVEFILWPNRIPKACLAQARTMIAGFIRAKPQALTVSPEKITSGPWASPRTMEMTAVCLAAVFAAGLPAVKVSPWAEAAIGELATELVAWLKDMDLPDIEDLLSGKVQLPADIRPDQQWVIAYGITRLSLRP